MPVIPDINPELVTAPSVPGFRPRNSEGARDLSDTLRFAGRTLGEVADKYYNQYEDAKGHQTLLAANQQLQSYQDYLKNGPTNEDGSPVISDGSQVDHNGQPIEAGLPVPPPPPTEHARLMKEKIQEIQETAKGSLAGFNAPAAQLFRDQFDIQAQKAQFDTQEHAVLEIQKLTALQQRSNLQQIANQYVNATPLQRSTIEQHGAELIDQMVKSKVISPEQAFTIHKEFIEQAEVGLIRKMLKGGEKDADGKPSTPEDVIRSIDGGEFNKLPADTQERWRNAAVNQSYTNEQRAIARLDKAERMQRMHQKQTDDRTSKDMTDLYTAGTLTPDIVHANKENLTPQSYQAFMAKATGDDARTNERALGVIHERIFAGEDKSADLLAMLKTNQLSRKEYDESMKLNKEFAGSMKGRPEVERDVKYIDTVFGAERKERIPGEDISRANAQKEFFQWNQAHPDAPAKEREDARDDIINRTTLVDLSQQTFTATLPKYYGGDRHSLSDPSIPLADKKAALQVAADKVALNPDKLTPTELAVEKARIVQWAKLVTKADAARQKQQAKKVVR